jgi:hypothetical protein
VFVLVVGCWWVASTAPVLIGVLVWLVVWVVGLSGLAGNRWLLVWLCVQRLVWLFVGGARVASGPEGHPGRACLFDWLVGLLVGNLNLVDCVG